MALGHRLQDTQETGANGIPHLGLGSRQALPTFTSGVWGKAWFKEVFEDYRCRSHSFVLLPHRVWQPEGEPHDLGTGGLAALTGGYCGLALCPTLLGPRLTMLLHPQGDPVTPSAACAWGPRSDLSCCAAEATPRAPQGLFRSVACDP